MPQPILVPGGIYRTVHGDLVEYISTSGKVERDREKGFRFYNVSRGGPIETIEADSLTNFLEFTETP